MDTRMPRNVDDEKKRLKILEGSRALFFREGVSSLTMDQIAARQGISKKTLYKFFRNKSHLVSEAIEGRLAEIGASINAVARDESLPFPERIGRIFGIVGRQFAQLGDVLIRDIYYHEPHVWERIDRFRREHVFVVFAELFEEGTRQGYVRADIETRLVPTLFINAISAVLTPEQVLGLPSPPAVVFETFIRILLGGILTEDGRQLVFAGEGKE
jgi:TetR/AcrR family transcriptional regulator, cholesterol catabolism regulator